MLPALAVYTPFSSRSRGARLIAFPAPRSLKEPIGWRFSSFSQISAGASPLRRTSGVRMADPAMRPRAARISSIEGGSIVRVALSSKVEEASGPGRSRLLVDVAGRRDVLDGDAERLEERDVLCRGPAVDAAGQDLADLPDDVVIADGPFLL